MTGKLTMRHVLRTLACGLAIAASVTTGQASPNSVVKAIINATGSTYQEGTVDGTVDGATGRLRVIPQFQCDTAAHKCSLLPAVMPGLGGDVTMAPGSTTVTLNNSGATAGGYGTPSAVPTLVVDAKGRVTSVTAAPISIGPQQVTGLAASATVDATDAGNITKGLIPGPRLDGVTIPHHYVGVNPVPLGAHPMGFYMNPAPTSADYGDFRFQRDETGMSGGTPGVVNTATNNLCYGGANVGSFLWCGLDVLHNNSKTGENVARYSQAYRDGTSPTWAFVADAEDNHNVNNPTSGLLGQEIDVLAAGTDNNLQRLGTDYVFGPPVNVAAPAGGWLPGVIAYGIRMNTRAGTSVGTAFRPNGNYNNAIIDCLGATVISSGCVWMKDGQSLIMSSNGASLFTYVDGAWQLRRNGTSQFSVDGTTGVATALGGFATPLFTPASSSAPCAPGRVADDASYHYVCTAANHWKRVALSDF